MPKPKARPPVIELLGPEDSGKSTFARLFIEAFQPQASILVVDPSPNQSLATHYGLEAPLPTLTEALSALRHRHPSPEELDWHFQELLIPLPIQYEGDRDILFLGALPEYGLFQAETDMLTYALPRLLQQADCVIHDGPLGVLKPFLGDFETSDVLVIRPFENDNSYCQDILPLCENRSVNVILSQATANDSLPSVAEALVKEGTWRFLGKVPPLPEIGPEAGPETGEPSVEQLPASFRDCFARLDLPVALSHH
jgi:hypothetical protein